MLAKRMAALEGWNWQLPVSATQGRKFLLFGRLSWTVRSNSSCRGSNVLVVIDDTSGEVVHKAFLPR